jgi:hypothetical protein
VEQSLREATGNLEQLTDSCAAYVDQALNMLDYLLESWPPSFNEASLTAIYCQCLRIVGSASVAGLCQLDRAAQSLCDVVDGLFASQQWDRVPIEVHVHAMRLLRTPDAHTVDVGPLMEGLDRVRARFAAEPSCGFEL